MTDYVIKDIDLADSGTRHVSKEQIEKAVSQSMKSNPTRHPHVSGSEQTDLIDALKVAV